MKRLPTYSWAAYAVRPGEGVVFKDGSGERLVWLERVERLQTEGEPIAQHGKSPCLLYFDGEPKPYYFASGHEIVQVFSNHRGPSSDD